MAKRKGPTPKRRVQHPRRRGEHRASGRWVLALAGLGALVFAATIVALARGNGDDLPGQIHRAAARLAPDPVVGGHEGGRKAAGAQRERTTPPRGGGGDGPVHVHGLGVNPRDGSLFIATHTGLWRVAAGERRPSRVTDRTQDTMGFTVVGPDLFLGSGHPDVRENLPPLLGLIESTDAGKSWQPISLLGEADFHVLRSKDDRVYGFDSTNGRLMFSRDRGRTWVEREPPGTLLDLAVHPTNVTHLVVSGEQGLLESRDDGRTWRTLGDQLGLLAWPEASYLYLVDQAGTVSVSATEGRKWDARGNVGGQPAALLATEGDLYVARHDGSIKRSRDGGRTWTIRSNPA